MVSVGAHSLGVAWAESTAVNRIARRFLGFVSLRAYVRPSTNPLVRQLRTQGNAPSVYGFSA